MIETSDDQMNKTSRLAGFGRIALALELICALNPHVLPGKLIRGHLLTA